MTAQQPAVTSSFMKSGISGKVLMLERWAAGKDYSAAPVEDDGCCFFYSPASVPRSPDLGKIKNPLLPIINTRRTKMKRKQRSIAGLLGAKNAVIKKNRHLPKHIYIYCKSENIARRFLKDAEEEGFTFGDGIRPTEKEGSDLFALHPDFTVSYTGCAGYMLFRNPECGNVMRIDYGKYISGLNAYM